MVQIIQLGAGEGELSLAPYSNTTGSRSAKSELAIITEAKAT